QDNDYQPWWQIDLGNLSTIEEIIIYNRTDKLQQRLNNFYVFVSATPFDENQSLQDLIDDNNVENQFFSGNAGLQETISMNIVGRYIRLQLDGNGPLHIAEFQVIGCGSTSSAFLYNIDAQISRLNSFDFIVFPVPSKQVFNLILPESFERKGALFVTDINGKVVLKKNIESVYRENLQFELKNISNGVYNVILKQKEFSWRKQIILRK
ncbi:discoidin domain-containing protein, partial [Croceitalea sp. P059]|uniref:discoidin domain-containing protein n=1 Tax=Croceitalea sp. P059 TaxID=3075601 RepID=UPI0028850CC0